MKEWIDGGNEVKEMGMFRIDGVRENQWDTSQPIHQMVILNTKLDKAYKWDYEITGTRGISQRRHLAIIQT